MSGLEGDAINIILAAAAANLRKLLAGFLLAHRTWLTALIWPHDRLIGIADSLVSVAQPALPTRIHQPSRTAQPIAA
ncbi:MAG: hypothetical protein GXP29_03040 [Planctomycetes bacterium]|nr:hypothetical protein [Planctomycetota bacterium]